MQAETNTRCDFTLSGWHIFHGYTCYCGINREGSIVTKATSPTGVMTLPEPKIKELRLSRADAALIKQIAAMHREARKAGQFISRVGDRIEIAS
jgi:hypothetical protein